MYVLINNLQTSSSANTIAPRKPLYTYSYALTRETYLRGYLGVFYKREAIVINIKGGGYE